MSLEKSLLAVRPILILPIGEFGRAAANQLKRLLPEAKLLEGEIRSCLETLVNDDQAIAVLVSWRPMPAISDLIDARAYRTGTASCSLMLKDHEMVMGPLIIPGFTSCWRCWVTRTFQADPHAKMEAAKRSFYAENPERGPRGYLPSLALLGAAQLAKALDSLQADAQQANVAVRTDLFTLQITLERAIGLDNCNRCGLRRPLDSRGYAGLQTSLWPEGSDSDRETR